ncbi:hypothetical protein [Hellea balneolensis]|uniref:hypothetical protein n=1 Tax=Hellea balneolensis TaxID=287478 RepID=UPI00040F2814|nr:hypothetical protein [Hellea balneolensis]
MKKILFTTFLVASFGASTAHATNVFEASHFTSSNTVKSNELLKTCLGADEATRKALRACNQALRLTAVSDIRSAIYVKRAFLNLSKDNMKAATRDFKNADKLGAHPDYTLLGQGYTALMAGETARAASIFNGCSGSDKTASMAAYGRAIAKEMQGDKLGAAADYKYAAKLSPNWSAPAVELNRIQGL